jgi:hypothetical protein
MKKLLCLALVFGARAFAAESGNISCETQKHLAKNAFEAHYTLNAHIVHMGSDEHEEARMQDVVMTVQGVGHLDDGKVETGRAKYLTGAKNSKATKYKDYYAFEMNNLTDTKEFGKFEPIDLCVIHVKIPLNMWNKNSFDAPVVTNCDQNGGVQTMDCDYTPGK